MLHPLRLLLLAAAAIGGTQLGSCIVDEPSDGCTLAGCEGAFRLETTIALPLASFRGAQARVCRSGECRSARLDVTQRVDIVSAVLPPSADSGPGAGKLEVGALATDHPDVTRVMVEWNLGSDWSPKELRDKYDVELEADGKSLYAIHKTVEYGVHQPNGASCEPTCYGASIRD